MQTSRLGLSARRDPLETIDRGPFRMRKKFL
jgi:hypothetical protein